MATQLEHQLVQNIEHLLHEHGPADVGRALRGTAFGVYVGSSALLSLFLPRRSSSMLERDA